MTQTQKQTGTQTHTKKEKKIEIRGYLSQSAWLSYLRKGGTLPYTTANRYIYEAVEYRELLYTTDELKEQFPGVFENPGLPLVLDVGCYYGDTLVELAQHNPRINVLGLDIKYKRVVKSSRKIIKSNFPNARVALCDIMDLMPLLKEHSVAAIFIFFPDPWTKKRHHRYRYIDETFLRDALSRLRPDGVIWLKSDHKEYYDEIKEFVLGEPGFRIVENLPGEIVPRPYPTIFEGVFLRQDIPIYQVMIGPAEKA